MLRADKVLPAGHWTGEPADSVVLEFDERYRRRFVMTGVGGLAFLLDLPEAAMLELASSALNLAKANPRLRPLHLGRGDSLRHLFVTCYTEGFSHFCHLHDCSSSFRLERLPVGLALTGKRHLLMAHTQSGHCKWLAKTSQRIPNGPERPVPILQAFF